jgi:formyl-CoA transferase
MHDVDKVAARRAPELGEHNDEVLAELGFTPGEIDGFAVRGIVAAKHRRAA